MAGSDDVARWQQNLASQLIKSVTFECNVPVWLCAKCGSRISEMSAPPQDWECRQLADTSDGDQEMCMSRVWKKGVDHIRDTHSGEYLDMWRRLTEKK